ncbi:hypothetical protein I3271_03375 [Photobacterium leiognathi]|uniref:hypothetical protein n=1 Tax=Photobacterium leiognathi TaxID=553611 RepID=UPI001EDFAC5B|nr:hypothetical protein [Photobacterium leiognathi]MCG3883722.1 hypothetical protein [Photobacterium leiognathi]
MNFLIFFIDGITRVEHREGVIDDKFYYVDKLPCLESVYYLTKCGQWLSSAAKPVLFTNTETQSEDNLCLNASTDLGKFIDFVTLSVIEAFACGSEEDLAKYISTEILPRDFECDHMGPLNSNFIPVSDYMSVFEEIYAYFKENNCASGGTEENIVTLS